MGIRRQLKRIRAWASGPILPPETDAIIEGVLNSPLPELVSETNGFATSAGLKIWYETIFPQGPPRGCVLLNIGMGCDGLLWPPKFVQAFVAAGYQLIRYDYRGTGLSDWVEKWDRKHPYAVANMAGDAVAVLDAVGVQRAHMVGLSMGGMIAQEVAIQNPSRVASLVLMMTSGYVGDPDLPGLTSRYFLEALVKGIPLLKYRLRGGTKNLIKERIANQILAMGVEGLDIKETAELMVYDRQKRKGINVRAMFQHQAAVTVAGSRYEKLQQLTIPTLVIHGRADQLMPFEHGQKLVEIMPKAEGLWLEGVAHVFPPPNMDEVMAKILAHLEAVS